MGEEQGKELERLRADLEVFERYGEYGASWTVKELRNKIAALEAEADPWREAKCVVGEWIDGFNADTRHGQVAHYARHLESENARLTARAAELDSRPVPPLDPARVKRTSLEVGYISGDAIMNAEPYPLAEPEK